MKCKLNNKCEFGDLCQQATQHDSLTVLGCSSYKAKKPLTNEEYLRSCSTKELAEFLFEKACYCSMCGDESQDTEEKIKSCPFGKTVCFKSDWEKWLKEIHHDGNA